ncbi:MAG TPA: hypothetical protein ENK96_01370, partial [Desulfobulbaceae bacterium]|nr:hypothetical protein [Desulfobulbaceae bacterium]
MREYIFTWIGTTPSTAEYRFYGENSYDSIILKDTLTLSNNKIVKVEGKHYFLDTVFLQKSLIQYEADKVISVVEYLRDSVDWVEYDSHLFEYDENGNLAKYTSGSTSTIYTYETDKGNLDLIYNKQYDFFYFYHPFPVTFAAGN